jgi:hypothetical protein
VCGGDLWRHARRTAPSRVPVAAVGSVQCAHIATTGPLAPRHRCNVLGQASQRTPCTTSLWSYSVLRHLWPTLRCTGECERCTATLYRVVKCNWGRCFVARTALHVAPPAGGSTPFVRRQRQLLNVTSPESGADAMGAWFSAGRRRQGASIGWHGNCADARGID